MSAWDHLKPGDLGGYRPWQCPHCGVYENPGPPDTHDCDPRSIVRVQAGRQVSAVEAARLEAWFKGGEAA